jgi:hypothetical protein
LNWIMQQNVICDYSGNLLTESKWADRLDNWNFLRRKFFQRPIWDFSHYARVFNPQDNVDFDHSQYETLNYYCDVIPLFRP